ncbi:hypothetical protein FOZ61_003771 [Perkinsus olseni]|uniref:Uncharacterized protein n=1 Tax=Perkinsus olseni TaxID=32597 RepID=A0A7J6MDP4_PEROL|nr:hypothetical protein FOZ61_003771 [Perkinsus olseni]
MLPARISYHQRLAVWLVVEDSYVTATGTVPEYYYTAARFGSRLLALLMRCASDHGLGKWFVPTEGNGMRIGYVTKGELDQAMAVGGTLNPQIIAEVRTRDGYIIDNEEALAIREDPTTGRTFVYTLSDNNYNEVRQKTLLSTYEWVAAAGTATPPPTTTAVPSLATSPTSYSLILFLTYIVPSTYY